MSELSKMRRDIFMCVPSLALGEILGITSSISYAAEMDSTERLQRIIDKNKNVTLEEGDYYIGGTLMIPDGGSLIGKLNCRLIKTSPVEIPMIQAKSVNDIVLKGFSLLRKDFPERIVVCSLGKDNKFFVNVSFPWKYPALRIYADSISTGKVALQNEDFKVEISSNELRVAVTNRNLQSLGRKFYVSAPTELSAFIALEDCKRVKIQSLTCNKGAIAYIGRERIVAELEITDCKVIDGQIRVLGPFNNFYPLMQYAEEVIDSYGPSSIRICRNTVIGKANSIARRPLAFSERVHGIIVSGYAQYVDVRENIVSGALGDGISMPSVSDAIVQGNTFMGNALSGIGPENGTVRRSERLKIYNNIVEGNWYDGLDLNFANPAKIKSEQLIDDGRGAVIDAIISGNKFHNNGTQKKGINGGCGIFARYAKKAEITENICIANNVGGIKAVLCSDLLIKGNELKDNASSTKNENGPQIIIQGGTKISIRDNIFDEKSKEKVKYESWVGQSRDNEKLEVPSE
ncbi:MAG: right-handed parallel beta-helix repeat-containing protein [Solimonas sp.]